jgi:hypothetical protein
MNKKTIPKMENRTMANKLAKTDLKKSLITIN